VGQEMATRQAPPRFARSAKVTNSSFALRATRLARDAFRSQKLKGETKQRSGGRYEQKVHRWN